MFLEQIAKLPASRILNLIQSYWLDEHTKYIYPEVESDPREDVRAQMDVVMYRRPETEAVKTSKASPYLEPDAEGFYPGLERAGRLDA